MRLLISGYYGFGNAGDEALLAAIVQRLRARMPQAELCVLSANPASTRLTHDVEAVQRWSVPQVWRALGHADLLIQGGGGLIQDVTSRVSPLYYLGILRLARLRRVPTVIFAQGIGPLRTPALRYLTRQEFSRAAAITVRDERSVSELRAMGLHAPGPVLVADPALLLEPSPQPLEDVLRQLGVDVQAPRLLLTLRRWPGVETAVSACQDLVRHAAERHGLECLVVAFQEPEDVDVAWQVSGAHPRAHLLTGVTHPGVLVAHIAAARVVVSMRLHGLIFAAAHCVPAIGLSYDPKLDAFAARARQPVIGLTDCSGEALTGALDRTLATAEARLPERQAAARELRAAAEVSFDIVERLVSVGPQPA